MPNIATALKQEIARIARRETRAEMQALQKSRARYRSEIAALKRDVAGLERQLAALSRGAKRSRGGGQVGGEQDSASQGADAKLRFRPAGLAAHRQRLGLSAKQAGQLLGVSMLTVYKWEKGEVRPRASQMPAIAAFRRLGKKEALARVGQ